MPQAKTDNTKPRKRNKALIDDMPPVEDNASTPVKKKKKSVWDGVLPENAAKPVTQTLPKNKGEKEHSYLQPAEVIVGRFYEVSPKMIDEQKIIGELVENEGNVQTIQVWQNGKPVDEMLERVFFGNRDVREISRETCFELSYAEMYA
jgi:hypothetical protein